MLKIVSIPRTFEIGVVFIYSYDSVRMSVRILRAYADLRMTVVARFDR